jgi:hypothetical protein
MALVAWGAMAEAQASSGQPRLETRLEAIGARHSTVQLGAGFSAMAGVYTRLGLLASGGAARIGDRTVGTARVEGVLRFHLDPLKQSKRGLYGIVGIGAMDDGTHDWEPRLHVGVGLEGRGGRQVAPAMEVALGGGLRVALAFRGTRPGRR